MLCLIVAKHFLPKATNPGNKATFMLNFLQLYYVYLLYKKCCSQVNKDLRLLPLVLSRYILAEQYLFINFHLSKL